MEHNLQFQQMNGLGEMLMAVIQRPRENEDGQWMSISEISALMKSHFKGYKEETAVFQKIGNYLKRPQYRFQSKHTMNGNQYWVKLR